MLFGNRMAGAVVALEVLDRSQVDERLLIVGSIV